MRISLIVAMDRHALIGTKDGLPWHLPADLERFRRITTGKTVIMGRATHEHIGRPLSDRFNIVLSRRQDYSSPGCIVAKSIDEALKQANSDEVFIIGGADVFRQAMPFADRICLTVIQHVFSGNTYFPVRSAERFLGGVVENDYFTPDDRNHYAYRFMTLDKRGRRVSIRGILDENSKETGRGVTPKIWREKEAEIEVPERQD